MSATSFTVDMTDISFTLFEQLRVHERLSTIEAYEDYDKDTLDSILEEAARIAIEVLHPINGPGDRQGCSLDSEGNVTTPDGFKKAWDTMAEGGWLGLTASADVGGIGLPQTIGLVATEMFSGAASAFQMYPGLSGAAARILVEFGPNGMRNEYAEKMFTGEWGGTMCLTEANAGSDVGDNRCRATRTDEPGVYHLEGEKVFISGGDHDLASNIIHLVLARVPDAPPGTKGLGLFLVPKFLVNDDLSLGDRNDAFVVGIEEKMGIHGSSTCTIALGANGPCKAWLIGNEFDGIRIMFHMMNEARIGVAMQGLSQAAAAYNYALAYCKERVQGSSIKDFKNPDAAGVPIIEHPDVRRMLMWQKVHVETMRSLIYRVAMYGDIYENTDDEALKRKLEARVDLLVPILKAHFTDISFDVAVQALQCFGGYGYISEYPIEQVVRDSKIFTIYEGTNGIQAMDLLGRKMRLQGGALFMDWMQDAGELVAKGVAGGFESEAASIGKAIEALGGSAMHLGGLAGSAGIEATMLQATPFLRQFGIVQLGLEALEQALTAAKIEAEKGESTTTTGKRLNLRFYVDDVLPQSIALSKSIRSSSAACLDPRLWS